MTDEELLAMVRQDEWQAKRRQRNRTKALRQRMLAGRTIMRCRWCRCILTLRTATIDHVTPISHGGLTTKANCVIACEGCNNKRGAESCKELVEAHVEQCQALGCMLGPGGMP